MRLRLKFLDGSYVREPSVPKDLLLKPLVRQPPRFAQGVLNGAMGFHPKERDRNPGLLGCFYILADPILWQRAV